MVLYGDPKKERDEERWIEKCVGPGDTVIDIGANIGTFSLKASKLVGNSGKVVSFEAHPNTAAILERNVALNDSNNIIVIRAAVGERNGEVFFSDESNDDINHISERSQGTKVTLKKLDDISELKEADQISCIKIDVEGYELPVLKGAESTLYKTQYVIFEVYEPNCRRFGYQREDLMNWFTSRGFDLLDPDTGQSLDQDGAGKNEVKNVMAVRRDNRP